MSATSSPPYRTASVCVEPLGRDPPQVQRSRVAAASASSRLSIRAGCEADSPARIRNRVLRTKRRARRRENQLATRGPPTRSATPTTTTLPATQAAAVLPPCSCPAGRRRSGTPIELRSRIARTEATCRATSFAATRVQTIEQLALQRDVVLPWILIRLGELRGTLLEFSAGSPELFRISRARIRSVENGLKALEGRHAWLADPANFERKRTEDAELRAAVKKDPAKEGRFGGAWTGIAQAVQAERELFVRHQLAESKGGLPSDLFEYARALVRAAEERPKPSPERLREYGDARLPSLETRLLRPVPVPRSLERVLLTFGLRSLRDTFGPDDPLVQAAIGKRSPEDVAREAVDGTRLDDPKTREALWKGGSAAVAASKDPMIALARRIDAQARAIRKEYENGVEGALARNGEQLFQAAVAVRGTASYPDATFTLRLSYGTIAGWTESGKQVPAMTRVSGLYARNTGQSPFAVAPTWLAARPRLDPEMPFDLATTNDIIGGNSGSPLVNRNGEVVALIFDGNRVALGGDYGYDAATNRAVALHGQAILEGLEKSYGAGRLVKEIRSR